MKLKELRSIAALHHLKWGLNHSNRSHVQINYTMTSKMSAKIEALMRNAYIIYARRLPSFTDKYVVENEILVFPSSIGC